MRTTTRVSYNLRHDADTLLGRPEYELDDEELDHLSNSSSATINASTSAPLLVGLLSRRSHDLVHGALEDQHGRENGGGGALAALVGDDAPEWLKKGGGMVSGIANM